MEKREKKKKSQSRYFLGSNEQKTDRDTGRDLCIPAKEEISFRTPKSGRGREWGGNGRRRGSRVIRDGANDFIYEKGGRPRTRRGLTERNRKGTHCSTNEPTEMCAAHPELNTSKGVTHLLHNLKVWYEKNLVRAAGPTPCSESTLWAGRNPT